ncbi:phospholipid-transporting ATPase 1 [Coprinopsis sp. MPI-PUGE-AT-0042]|nr:phospholipid-transporting ATPase 1 [Coprinopsis sp. MPI-PUGE-AT-0042]
MSFFKRRPIVDEHDSDGDNDGNIDPELRLRTVRTAASAIEVSVKAEQRAEKRKSRRFFSRKKKKDLQPPNQPSGPRRNVYVNYPLSAMEVDRDGEPRVRYVRNKVRTTKYTVLTFIPKNLYEQFRRVANLFFLTLVVLQLFPVFGAATGAIAVMPLAFILTVTAIKDGIEDYSRGVLDEEVNNSAATKLDGGWRNVNQPTDPRTFWEKLLGLNTPGKVTRGVRKLRDREAGQARIVLNRGDNDEDSSVLTHDMGQSSIDLTKGAKGGGVQSVDSHNYPPTSIDTSQTSIDASQWGRVGPLSQYQDSVRSHTTANGVVNWGKRTAGTARWERTLWKKLEVGDIVLLRDNDQVPADIIVLATSDPDGMCYLETKNLDGETNLKPRKALRATWSLASEEDVERSSFYVDSEPPHQNLYQYHGVLRYNHPQTGEVQQEPISINELLLRGCILRNTSWIIGLVMFTGPDTKIMLNGGDTPSKRSKIEKETNFNVIVNFVLLAIMCIISAIFSGLADAETDTSSQLFEQGSEPTSSFVVNAIITFVSCLILLQNIVPISLYISIEIVKTIQAYFISQDIDMYYAPYDTPCVPKTWNISDDLGQIEYIFSDKTGTLTQNIMEFQRCSINGVAYGEGVTEAQRGAALREGKNDALDPEELNQKLAALKQQMVAAMERAFKNRYTQTDKLTLISPKFAQDLTDQSGGQRDHMIAFFRALALCHTVLSDKPDPQSKPYHLEYKAESPDEAALVAAAREVGFPFIHKSKDLFQIEVLGREERYTLLKMLEFNSTRKRMSVLMRCPDGRIILYCKGADSVIYERLDKGHDEALKEQTRKDMETFANSGLRTLCIAYRYVTDEEYGVWVKAYDAATNAIDNRDEAIDQANELMEHSLLILGATALEDKLQEGVPEAIELLHRAGIKLWILTGDKLQTAIEIGYSCNLLKTDMDLMIISAESLEQTRSQIEAGLNKIASVLGPPTTNPRKRGFVPGKQASFAVVIDGDTLRHALTPELKELFLNLGTQCETVVCCRALTVKLVKEGRNAMTLSIGDGANDVAMIQEANIGCGLFGLEGSQAAMSADYAFGQFRFLTKLLLVHGRWSYQRVAEMHSNFFYKNVIWTLALFWYLPFNSFQATYLYQYTFILLCNLVFTSLPVIVLGAFDQDINAKAALAFPQLYVRGIRGLEYTRAKFWWYMIDGFYQSAVVFFIPYLSWVYGSPISWTGRTIESISDFGTTVAVSAIFAANTYVGINTNYWTAMTWIVVLGSTIVMWLWVVVYSFFPSIDFIDEAQILFGTVSFWTTVFLTVLACLAPRFIFKYVTATYFPLDKEIVREMWVKGDLKDRLGLGHRKRGTMASHHSSASSLEAAPMIYEPHHDTSSEMALNEFPVSKRESYQSPPSMSEANAQYIPAPAPAGDALLSPSRAYNNDRDRKNTVVSPSPSYYSASDLPPSSPLPSPKYKYSTGEVTSTPPPPSRRASAASRAPSRRSPPPGPMPTSPLPPQPPTSGTPTYSPLATPTTPSYPQMPPPSSYLQANNRSRTHLRDPSGTSSHGHSFERSGSSAASYVSHAESYATAADEFFDAEPQTPKQQQSLGGQQQYSPNSNNPFYRMQQGGESDDAYGGMAVSQQPPPTARQLQEPSQGPYPHHGHPRNEPTDQWEGPTAM